MKAAAVFLDRDGTVIEDRSYIGDPEQVQLFPDAAAAIKQVADAGLLVVLASNQSGIARGKFDEAALARVHARMESMLHEQGAKLDGAYYCPYLDGPEAVVEAYRRDSNLRKPRPGMLLQAAEELDIDLAESWMVGDSAADIEAGSRAGCRTILLCRNGARVQNGSVRPDFVVGSLAEVPALIAHHEAAAPSAPPPPEPVDARVAFLLERIHNELERALRHRRQRDFSGLQMIATLVQLLAVVTCVWGAVGLVDDHIDAAAARFALACFLQLATATAWMIDRFRQ